MKIGDYVRTKSYGIKKINGFSSTLEEDFIDCDYDKYQKVLINKKEVVKSSSNIIDLIEVGDYVNGYKVLFAGATTWDNDGNVTDKRVKTNHDGYDRWLSEDFIKSIVTHEQFESMKYEVN